mmetsp:Transcript_6726/g.16851  ORF Transcript_6726/g.16851 Transcript_6726/m.16851 type:complete len:154 (+) Transcript_6726:2595-3056(+)
MDRAAALTEDPTTQPTVCVTTASGVTTASLYAQVEMAQISAQVEESAWTTRGAQASACALKASAALRVSLISTRAMCATATTEAVAPTMVSIMVRSACATRGTAETCAIPSSTTAMCAAAIVEGVCMILESSSKIVFISFLYFRLFFPSVFRR